MLKLSLLLVTILLSSACPGHAFATETIPVLIRTSAGNITLELYPEAAPVTVANFLKFVDAQFYDNKSSFYRTVRMNNQTQNNIKIEVIQGGLGMEGSAPAFEPIAHESTESTGILHKDGVISMARLEPGSASSEFFICINDQPALDYGGMRNPDGLGFASFGKVVEGMDVVRSIQNFETDIPEGHEFEYTSGQILLEPVAIYQVSRIHNK